MPLDWIKVSCDLHQKRQTLAVRRAIKLRTTDEAVGLLVRFWVWAEHQSDGGRVAGLSAADLDELMGRPGFAAALVAVGWLAEDADGLTVPGFDEYMGTDSHRRQLARDRQRKRRAIEPVLDPGPPSPVTPVSRTCHADVTPVSRPARDENVTQEREGEEEREEEELGARRVGGFRAGKPPDPAAVEAAEAAIRLAASGVEPVIGWSEFAAAWEAAGLHRGKAVDRTSQRVAWLQQRCRDPAWVAGWRAAVERLGRSKFARGETGKAGVWVDTFLEKPGTLQKALDGRYDDESSAPAPSVAERAKARAEELRRRQAAAGD